MQDLKELVYILKQHNLTIVNSNGLPLEKNTMLWKLYSGLEKGKINSDEEAEQLLYKGAHGGSKYRQLKFTLRERMMSAIINFEAKGDRFTDYQKAYYESHREWLIVKILTGQNANTAAISLAVKLLKQAQKFEFTMLTVDIASYLAYQYGLRENNDRKFKQANALYTESRQLLDAEALAEQLYTELMVKVVNSKTSAEEVALLAREAFVQIDPFLAKYTSYRLHLFGNMIGLMRFTSINQYQDILPICNKAIAFFESKPYEARVPLQMFYYQKLICYIHMKSFSEGEQVAQYCLGLLEEGTFNWFKYMELYLRLAFHSGEMEKGVHILSESLKHPRFQFLPDNTKELWRIYASYGYYLGITGCVKQVVDPTFKLGKFINETPIFSKDKSGMNVAIIVIKNLILLAEKKSIRLLDGIEAIEQYCYRYLNNADTARSAAFLKMLLLLPSGNLDRESIEKRVEKYQKVLEQYPVQMSDQTLEIEIIPYDRLWKIALDSIFRTS